MLVFVFLIQENIRADTKIAGLLRVQAELHESEENSKMMSKMEL